MLAARQALAVLVLPVSATVVVPALLASGESPSVTAWPAAGGGVLIAAGLVLVVSTVRLFTTVGRGTLAPWDPTERLVVRGPYRHVRNPMISGVALILLGEAALMGSLPVLGWAAVFLTVNAIWFPLVEEPGLVERFGADYERYRANVPRWIPRLRPWDPADG